MPETPLAMLGAAPSTTTNRIARSLIPRTAGSPGWEPRDRRHVCSPVDQGPTAKSPRGRTHGPPTRRWWFPMSRASAKPATAPRTSRGAMAAPEAVGAHHFPRPPAAWDPVRQDVLGPSRTTTICQAPSTRPMASSLGQLHAQIRDSGSPSGSGGRRLRGQNWSSPCQSPHAGAG